jgi:pimeloyl-ACP methyl ester carboxylesterase
METMTTSTLSWHLDRPGGRRVAVHDLTPDAPAAAPVVLLCHPAPGSAVFDPDPAATRARGVRLLALDRPGYGASDPIRDGFATVDSAADDAAAVLDVLLPAGTTAGVAGWSAGGRVALAVAARRPELVDRVAVLATPAPDEEVGWIPEEHRAGIEALRGAPAAAAHAALTAAFGPMPEAVDARLGLAGVDVADAAVLERPGVRERLRAMLDAALEQGVAGMVADIAGYTLRPWGFDPSDVGAEVLLGYGADDSLAGAAHGAWWQQQLPRARLELEPGVGHLVVVPMWGRVLAHLAP